MNIRSIQLPLVLAVLFLLSCQKERSLEISDPYSSATDTMRLTLNGVDWAPPIIKASAIGGQLTITGAESKGYPVISLVLPQDIADVHPLDVVAGTYVGYYASAPSDVFGSYDGSIQIFENDSTTHRVRGSFQYRAVLPLGNTTSTQTGLITAGYFSVEYF